MLQVCAAKSRHASMDVKHWPKHAIQAQQWLWQKAAPKPADWPPKTAKPAETVGQLSAVSERLHEAKATLSAVFAVHPEGLGGGGGGGFFIFSQPTRLYRCARVVNNLVKNISTKRLSCLNSLK